jgi:hypothetical protein
MTAEPTIWTVFNKDEVSGAWMWALIGRGSGYVYGVGTAPSADQAAQSAREAYLAIGGMHEEKK